MFQKGVQNWKLRKTNGGGRIPAEITKGIISLGVVCLSYMSEVMARQGNDRSKLEVTKIIMGKLAPDLTAEVGSEWIARYDERAEQFVAKRIGGDKGLQIITPREPANGTTGGV